MAAISFPTAADTPSRTTYTISAPWTDSVNGGEWWFSSTKVRWMPVVAGGGASDFGDLGGVPADNVALTAALDLKAPLASPTFTGTVTGPIHQAPTTAGMVLKNSAGVSLLRVGVYDATTTYSTGVAEGGLTTASGNYSHAEGAATIASGDWAHAEGKDSTASGAISHAEGYNSLASGGQSHAAGTQARAIHAGARVMTDSQAANCDSLVDDSCTMRYAGGYRFLGGAATFSGAIGGTTGTFSGAVTAASYTRSGVAQQDVSTAATPTFSTVSAAVVLVTGNGFYAAEQPIRLGTGNAMYFRALGSSEVVSLTSSAGGANYRDLSLRNLTATGTVKTVAYLKATAIATSHATAIAAGDGAQAYISDDDKPVWSNGTVWKLSDGTTLA